MENSLSDIVNLNQYPIHDLNSKIYNELTAHCKSKLDTTGCCVISNFIKPDSINKMLKGGSGGTNYQFASSNPMWRATLEILDFLPLANVDYSGGIITTDWYNEGTSLDESIKITVRFLTNEIRSDGIRIIVHKKRCNVEQSCKISKITSAIEQELQVAILKKAILFEREYNKNKKKYKRGEVQ